MTKAEISLARSVNGICQNPFKLRHIFSFSHFVIAVIHPRDRKRVGFSHALHLSIVCTPIWFRNKYTGRTPITVTWLDEVVLEQILNIPSLRYFCLLGFSL